MFILYTDQGPAASNIVYISHLTPDWTFLLLRISVTIQNWERDEYLKEYKLMHLTVE